MDNKEKQDSKTAEEVFDELTEEQKRVVFTLIGMLMNDENKDEEDGEDGEDEKDEEDKKDKKGDGNMKHNVFDNDERKQDYLRIAPKRTLLSWLNQVK